MDKRLVNFLLLSTLIMLGYFQLQLILNPPKPPAENGDEVAAVEAVDENGNPVDPDAGNNDDSNGEGFAASDGKSSAADGPSAVNVGDGDTANQRYVLGSHDTASPYQMSVYFNNRGASIERLELNNPRYQDLDDKSGWLGSLTLRDHPKGGCSFETVANGTPAANAIDLKNAANVGLLATTDDAPGDRILKLDDDHVDDAASFRELLSKTTPRQEVDITVMRLEGGLEKELRFRTTLVKRPLAVIAPEAQEFDAKGNNIGPAEINDQLSFLLTLGKLGDARVGVGRDEIAKLPSLRTANWVATRLPAAEGVGEGIEFAHRLTSEQLAEIGADAPLTFVKRYRLASVDRSDEKNKEHAEGYIIDFEVEIRNEGDAEQKLAYQLDGPTGLTKEGWWYSFKVHPTAFGLAGARDIVWRKFGDDHKMTLCSEVTKNALSDEKVKSTSLFDANENTKLQYIGGDAQYFAVVLKPDEVQAEGPRHTFSKAEALAVGTPDKKRKKRTNTSFRLTSRDINLPGGKTFTEKFEIFAGPKKRSVLEQHELGDCIVYGWFGAVAKPLGKVLHFFHAIIGSWGIAIIMLTVLVRGLLYPFGRKMARNAQKMQELKPEMDKLNEKYKDDLEKKAQAQRELFAKHNYNPFAGCMVMFFQFPIFIGLYRTLSVDIALRQAPFFPGMKWCSNLAGPDQLWNWTGVLPDALTSTNGWLGPYLNILPLIAAALMFVQQKLFTPPPSDEQQEMQQKIMKFMMIFMGLLFFKFAAGLCVYFIVSSLWGVAERKLLPKSKPVTDTGGGGGNGGGGGGGGRGNKGGGGSPAPAYGKPVKKKSRFEEFTEKLENMANQKNGSGNRNGNGQTESPDELRKKRKKKRKKK